MMTGRDRPGPGGAVVPGRVDALRGEHGSEMRPVDQVFRRDMALRYVEVATVRVDQAFVGLQGGAVMRVALLGVPSVPYPFLCRAR